MANTNTDALLREQLSSKMMQFIGMIIQALFNGGLLTLGVNCIFLLRPKIVKSVRQRWLWRLYIAMLLITNLGFLTAYFLWNTRGIFFNPDPKHQLQSSLVLRAAASFSPVAIICMTDCVLVWRCYTVQNALGGSPPPILGRAFFLFPLFLWIVTTSAALAGSSLDCTSTHIIAIPFVLRMIGFISNILLNLYSTIFIATRLLLHRRMIVKTFGRAAPEMQYLRIVTILLESAAINIPITIVAAVGFAFGRVLGSIALPIVTACQSFASVLILHQIALGRAIGQRDRTELSSDSRRQHLVDTWISE